MNALGFGLGLGLGIGVAFSGARQAIGYHRGYRAAMREAVAMIEALKSTAIRDAYKAGVDDAIRSVAEGS